MEEGAIVKAIDGSYSVKIGKTKLLFSGNICQGQRYILIATNCDLPSDKKNQRNDVVMKDLTTGDILFAQERFLRTIHQCEICPRCGQKI
jgi:hypothetical protein